MRASLFDLTENKKYLTAEEKIEEILCPNGSAPECRQNNWGGVEMEGEAKEHSKVISSVGKMQREYPEITWVSIILVDKNKNKCRFHIPGRKYEKILLDLVKEEGGSGVNSYEEFMFKLMDIKEEECEAEKNK